MGNGEDKAKGKGRGNPKIHGNYWGWKAPSEEFPIKLPQKFRAPLEFGKRRWNSLGFIFSREFGVWLFQPGFFSPQKSTFPPIFPRVAAEFRDIFIFNSCPAPPGEVFSQFSHIFPRNSATPLEKNPTEGGWERNKWN